MNIIQTERAAETVSQEARFAKAEISVPATSGRQIVVERENDAFRVTVWSDNGRQWLFGATGKTVNSAFRKGVAFVYGKAVAKAVFA